MRKKNAIMIADTRPALIGNLLVQLKDTNEGLFDEAIIYYEDISEKDKKIMQSIMPCRFEKFDYQMPDNVKKLPAFDKFSSLMFSRYYMFDLLDEYETITWLDTDVLICGKLDSIIDIAKENGMAANFEDPKNKSYKAVDFVKTNFSSPIGNYNMNLYNMSSGLIVVANTLKNKEEMTKWCFEKTIEYADNLILPDQGVLNLLVQEFDINVGSVGENGAYCFYPSYKRDATNAKIVHAWGARKFWKSWYLYKTYPKWQEYYSQWLKLGGSDIFGSIRPDVSIVIPTYKTNIEYFKLVLEDLLVSQVQEHGFQYDNFEIIIVVDGDENEPLIKLLEKYDDPRVNLIINAKRAGIAKSINIGIKNAKADFIARIDDDDRVNKNRLYKQYQYLMNHKDVDLVTSNFEYFGDMNEERISFEGDMSKAWSIFTCPFNHPTVMFRKEFFVKNKLLYDETRSHVEDWELWLRCFDKGMKVGNIPEVLYYHRWHNGSAGQNQKTIDMMRELIKNNFKKLDVELTEKDLKIVPPWNGKVSDEEYSRLEEIFTKTLENNEKSNKYNSHCLKKAFDYRLEEAKKGKIKDIVIEKKSVVPNQENRRSIKQKILGPFYRPFKRILYNITTEAVNDSISNIMNNNDDTKEENSNFLESQIIGVRHIHDQIYDLEKKYDFLRNSLMANMYLEKKIFLIGTSEHSNIGDSAITLGAYEFIRKHFNEYKLVEITTYDFKDSLSYLENIINPDDLIFLQGGGNLGNRYLVEEVVRRTVIDTFMNNKIVILPQTIYFDDSQKGKEELEISKKIYNKHPNLTIFTRGKISLGFARKHFNNAKSYLSLDNALNINLNYNYERKGILSCIRDLNDESGFNKNEYEQIISIIEKNDSNFDFTTNVYSKDIFKDMRNAVVYEQFKNFAKHKLVVTDRLHGLIFALITNTPCIVLSSYNYKLKEFSDMLNEDSIVFIDKDISKLDKEIKKFLNNKKEINNNYRNNFDKVADLIKK